MIPEEEVWNLQPEVYKLIIGYEYPKLAKVCKIEPKHVVDYLKLSNVSIDGTSGYAGNYEVIDPDHVTLKMYECEVMQKYRDEGLYPPDRAWTNCTFEQRISEPFCVWHYTKEGE